MTLKLLEDHPTFQEDVTDGNLALNDVTGSKDLGNIGSRVMTQNRATMIDDTVIIWKETAANRVTIQTIRSAAMETVVMAEGAFPEKAAGVGKSTTWNERKNLNEIIYEKATVAAVT